ncbi:14-alpha sterol demethylase Cyp51A [Nemania abortiva]|nr:14-alpha sterol demethylase Cyp51A [Nemania abortiva]
MDFHPVLRVAAYLIGALLTSILANVLQQKLLRRHPSPPLVFHWVPFLGNAVCYGRDPVNFYQKCREKHGDVFTFVLLGKRMTVCLGRAGNEFVLGGRVQDVNAEDIYGPLTTPVFGADVVYDCPNAKLMEQKRFVKVGLTQRALETYVPLIEREVLDYLDANFRGARGKVNVSAAMSEITLFTAARTLQGAEVRAKLSASFAELYHDLDMGFQPINFLMPWAPLPQNRRRDAAHLKMRAVYIDLINDRRRARRSSSKPDGGNDGEPDMLSHLMSCVYKNGKGVPDKEIANMMITLLMGGQHSSSSAGAWIIHRLASQPSIAEAVYEESVNVLGCRGTSSLRLSDLDKLPLLSNVIKETLRVHSSIHTIMRKAMQPIAVPNTPYVIARNSILIASPIMSHMSASHFPSPQTWDPYRWTRDHRLGAPDPSSDDVVDYGYGTTSKGTSSPYLPFGAGRHRCIGEKFAYLNLATIVLTLVRRLKLATLDGTATVPATDYTSLFSRPVPSAEVRWEHRVLGSP